MSFEDCTTTEDPAVASVKPAAPQVKEEPPATDDEGERQGDFLLLRKAANGRLPGVYRELMAKSGATYWHRLCAPLEILANTRTAQGQGWGRLVAFTDPDGTEHRWAIPARLLEGDGVDMRAELADLGLAIMPDRRAREGLVAYIATWTPPKSIRCVARVGWHEQAFVLPDTPAFGATEEIVVQANVPVQPFATAGTLDGWRDEIARHAAGNSRLAFAISLGFAGPLIDLLHEESGGVHIYGRSSGGKTTALDLARSVCGLPRGSWRTTDNAAEALAAGASDCLLTLDEIAEAPPKVVAELSYMLGNQRGKARLSRTTALRSPMTWRILFLSTGELPLAAKLGEAGQRVQAGQAVRVIDLPAECGAGPDMGVFDRLPEEFPTAYAFAIHLKNAVDHNHGLAFREFLARLTSDLPTATLGAREIYSKFMRDHEPKNAAGQVKRVLGRFGMIAAAGELATAYGITGWLPGEATDAARRCFNAWLSERGGTGPAEERAALEQVRFFLEKYGESRFAPIGDDYLVNVSARDRAGFREPNGDGWSYFVLPEVWRQEVCKGLDHKAVAELMLTRGWLRRNGADRPTYSKRIQGHGTLRLYAVQPSFLTEDAPSPPAEPAEEDCEF